MFYNFLTKYTDIFVEKNDSFLHFFQQKILVYFRYFNVWIFNETLTNDVVSFEQPGPISKHFKLRFKIVAAGNATVSALTFYRQDKVGCIC